MGIIANTNIIRVISSIVIRDIIMDIIIMDMKD
jgi:hypothetical protein